MELTEFFRFNPRAALAFSGGVDSAYLLYAGIHAQADIRAYYVKTEFQPQFELDDARRLASELGAELSVIELNILPDDSVIENSPERCYHCKRRIIGAIKERAAADGYTLVLDGTNASDDAGDRPGMRALYEFGVVSPLRKCGLTKARIRELSKQAGLFTWNKPAYSCLATRIPTGERITREILIKVEAAESRLFEMGFSDFRVRTLHGAARLQFPFAQMETAFKMRDRIISELKPYFDIILFDLKGR